MTSGSYLSRLSTTTRSPRSPSWWSAAWSSSFTLWSSAPGYFLSTCFTSSRCPLSRLKSPLSEPNRLPAKGTVTLASTPAAASKLKFCAQFVVRTTSSNHFMMRWRSSGGSGLPISLIRASTAMARLMRRSSASIWNGSISTVASR